MQYEVENLEEYLTSIPVERKEAVEKLNKILAKNTGQKLEKIEKDVERDFWMSAEEAKKYGLIDKIL